MKASLALAKRVQVWVWVLVYAGLGLLALGISVRRQSEVVGWPMIGGGLVLVVAGIVLIAWRSRMRFDAVAGASADKLADPGPAG